MTKEQLLEDIKFLSERANKANGISFKVNKDRDTGASSNSIVSIAYGVITLEKQCFPWDKFDLTACERMWEKLPEHRKKGDALKAMKRARNCEYYGKPL